MTKEGGRRGSRGRPRSETTGPAILRAARELVGEHGYDAVTTRMIADRARAGKEAIYRRWSGKAELVLDAFRSHAEDEIDEADYRGPLSVDIADFLNRMFDALRETGPAVRVLMAYAQHDPEFRALMRQRFIRPRREAFRRLLQAGRDRGEIPKASDLDVVVTTLYGAMWYRLLMDEPLDQAFSASLAKFAIAGLGGC
ncbi:MAG TPA: TetR/AcrR family transcriptional regulator [Rhodopila sp.]|uniref:TetR/AcrR family transcriptional regulator n=1 Tax=Rhodopila sp. TaxID=2480087 RepID=UPI002C5775EA|nr:TetR/AcrR family transcriptional regulator [Rhodopila sp.]HVY16017.1 TetR/AcrR family transcriptional regulator [Rhodopila sp.]